MKFAKNFAARHDVILIQAAIGAQTSIYAGSACHRLRQVKTSGFESSIYQISDFSEKDKNIIFDVVRENRCFWYGRFKNLSITLVRGNFRILASSNEQIFAGVDRMSKPTTDSALLDLVHSCLTKFTDVWT